MPETLNAYMDVSGIRRPTRKVGKRPKPTRSLYEFKLKSKTSPMSQLADLYLWAIAIGGYHASNRTFKRLKDDGKLIECVLPEADWETLGSKYSCFEGVERVA